MAYIHVSHGFKPECPSQNLAKIVYSDSCNAMFATVRLTLHVCTNQLIICVIHVHHQMIFLTAKEPHFKLVRKVYLSSQHFHLLLLFLKRHIHVSTITLIAVSVVITFIPVLQVLIDSCQHRLVPLLCQYSSKLICHHC